MFSRQIRDSIFDDVIFDLCRKENLPKGIIDPVPYLLGMAKNIIKRYLDNGEFNFRSEENYANRADPESGIEKDEGIDKCIESIKVLLNKLPKSYAEIIEDYWLKGKTLSDICEDRNYKSLKTLSSMKSQALKALLKIIEECDNHHELKFWLRRMENNKENGKKL